MYRKLLASLPLERRVALISGGCSGVGRLLATRLAQAGAQLALLDLDRPALEGLVEHLADHHNAEVLGLPCDVTDVAAVEGALALLGERFGGLDLLVCCAAAGHRGAVLGGDPEAFRQVMAVNFFGALHCAQAALPSLLARRGQIVAFATSPAFSPPQPGQAAEAASRQALHGLFETLRLEVAADGVNVMLVCPAAVAGEPDGRGSAQEVAEAIFQGLLRRRHLLMPPATGWCGRLRARFVL